MKTIMAENKYRGRVVAVSGGWDPVHVGHIELFKKAKELGDTLIVIINGDSWLRRKKGRAFMSQNDRATIIKEFACVDDIFIWESEADNVCGALEEIRPYIFANGGDRRSIDDIPENEICERLGIEMVFNVGDKIRSSSDFLEAYDGKKYNRKI